MEEKNRKKTKKKKKRAGPQEDVVDASIIAVPSTSEESKYVVGSPDDIVGATTNAAELASRESRDIVALDCCEDVGAKECKADEVRPVFHEDPVRQAVPSVELQPIIEDLRMAIDSDTRKSPAFTSVLSDIKSFHATSQVNLEYMIDQLRVEICNLNLAASSQKNKEGNLESIIELLRGEVSFLNSAAKSQKTKEENLEYLIEQLREEISNFSIAANLQKKKEVDLEGDIHFLREEMAHLKGMLQAEREKKVVEATEILQLREEVAKLSEGSVKQSQMVKEICDTAHVLLKLLPQTTLMSSSQFVQNPLEQDSFSLSHEAGRTMTVAVEPSLASHGAVQSTENKDVLLLHFPEVSPIAVMDELILDNSNQMNSHPGMLNYMEQHDVQTESIKDESIDLITSIANLPVQERQTGFHETEISTAYVDVDKHGVVMDGSITSFDGTNAVIGNQVSPEDRGPHQDDIPRIDPSFPSHPDGLKADDLKPFSDAPITGAPIRLFKFVARYVSGADLVKQ